MVIHKFPSEITKFPDFRFPLYFFLASLQYLASAASTLLIPPDPKNAVLFGYSSQRLFLVVFTLTLAGLCLAAAVTAYRKRMRFSALHNFLKKRKLLVILYLASFLVAAWGWVSVFCPPYLFGKWIYLYQRLQPVSIAAGLGAGEFLLLALVSSRKIDFSPAWNLFKTRYLLPVFLTAVVVLAAALWIGATKTGLVLDTPYWNVPGIPLTGLQFFGLVIVTGALVFLTARVSIFRSGRAARVLPWLLPVAVYLAAVLVWGLTPMIRDTLASLPVYPHYQPFPLQDAKVHDVGAISILEGHGILFKGYTDKPLYMIFLAFLHTLAGYDYYRIAWLQIAWLGLVPVIQFFLGKKFHSTALGIFIAVVMILRQRNAILLSLDIASVNPKLLMTEIMTLFNLVLFTYLVFLWFKSGKGWLALLAGGAIGVASLVRLNPFLLFPAFAVLVVPAFWKSPRRILSHSAAYILGFAILVGPWLVSGRSPEGYPWFFIKFIDVINVRYSQTIQPAMQVFSDAEPDFMANSSRAKMGMPARLSILPANTFWPAAPRWAGRAAQDPGISGNDLYIVLNHWLHNFATSALTLPDSVVYDDLEHLSKRAYWIENEPWSGHFSPAQSALILLNLALVSTGIGYSWKRYRWAGVVPLVVFLSYSLALAFAKNSGSRYIVPVDWILHFYYGLAIVLVFRFIACALGLEGSGNRLPAEPILQEPVRDRRNVWFSLALLAVLASLIPISNDLIPAIQGSERQKSEMSLALSAIPVNLQSGERVEIGDILYPYYAEDGNIYFTLLTSTDTNEISIPSSGSHRVLFMGERVFLHLAAGDGDQEIIGIYTSGPEQPERIWPVGD